MSRYKKTDGHHWQHNLNTVRKLKSNEYGKVIEVTAPVRFYWDENGDFEGIEFGPFSDCVLSRYKVRLMDDILDVVEPLFMEELSPIPDYVLRAFEE